MNRKELMTIANAIHKNSDSNLKESLTIAHKVMDLKNSLRANHITEFLFKKKDGSVRYAKGTLVDVITDHYVKGTSKAKPRYDVIKYFDLEKNTFRSFKAENFLTIVE